MRKIMQVAFASLILFLSMGVLAKTHDVKKWEVLDIRIDVEEKVEKPFKQDVIATFKHASGKERRVPLVYDGFNKKTLKQQWLLRFSASEMGKWKYKIKATINSIDGKKGKVKVLANEDKTNHGAMVLNPDKPQSFYYEDGTPYFVLGYELDWLFALDYENEEGLPKSEHLLSLLKDNGFNHMVMNVYAHDVSWEKDPKLAEHPDHEFGGKQNIFPFLGSNENPDFSALNVEFFQKFDRTVSLLHDKRIVSHLMIYVWNKMVSWPDMDTEADNMYFDYVVKRYQAFPNIVFDISKEALYYGRADEAYIKNRIDRLQANNDFDRLVTVHDFNYCTKYPEQVDFISTQDWSHDIYNQMLTVRKNFPNKPIYNIEHGGYEESPYKVFTGDYVDPEVTVRRNWMTLFAGVYSTHYWQANAWNVIIYNPYEQPADFIKPKFEYFKHMTKFFEEYEFSDFKPAPGKNGSGKNLVNDEKTHLIYVSKDNYMMSRGNWYLKPNGKNPPRNFKWFNTLTGEMTVAKPIVKSMDFISPWRGEADAILISEVVKAVSD